MPETAALREEMVRIGRLLYNRQLIVAAEGNLSTRLGGELFLVTPAGVSKGFLSAEALLVVEASGSPTVSPAGREAVVYAAGEGVASRRSSSEWPLHREIYARRSDIQAVCHAHPPWATAFAAASLPLDGCLLPEIVATLGQIPLAPYGTPGTSEVPRSVRDLIMDHDAVLLANHGVVTVGDTLTEAYFRLESVERLAQVTLLARLAGGERRLSSEEAVAVRALAGPALVTDSRLPCVAADEGDRRLEGTREPARPGVAMPREAHDAPSGGDLEAMAERLAQQVLAEIHRQGGQLAD